MRFSRSLLLGLSPLALAANPDQTDDVFDYIVVGSGPGGGPLAVNLAAEGYTVLLLEAGRNYTSRDSQQIPAFFSSAQWDEDQSWEFYVKLHENETLGAQNSKMVWEKPDGEYWVGLHPPKGSTQLGIWYPRAGTLGGCDTHNGGLTVLPSNWDWDNVVEITGDESWGHEEMLHYFTRIERNLYLPDGTPNHGFSGYQPVGVGEKHLFEQEPQILSVAQAAAAFLGYENRSLSTDFDVITNKDINKIKPGRDTENDIYQLTFKKDEMGRRYSAANRVSDGVAAGLPLTVRFDSLVTKVDIDDDLRATGVQYLEGEKLYKADPRWQANSNNTGIPRSARAKREVILAGGTFNTPQLLLLSGIGPAEHLKEHAVDVKVDLPGVGRGLQDHYEVPVMHQFANNFTFWDRCNVPENEASPCYEDWLANGTGEWSTLGFVDFIMYTSSVAPRNERDVILYGVSNPVLGHLPPYTNWTGLVAESDVFTYTLSEAHMRTRGGRVTLRSNDPTDVPDIYFAYFDGEGADDDVQGLVDAIEFARGIFDRVPSDIAVGERYPGRDDVKTQEQLKEFVKSEAYGHHATGTARIGGDDDPLAVTDSEFRVRGVKGLRVVDASVFPEVVGSFPLIAVFMVSEKASDVIAAAAREYD
ncbi:hypothetical protein ACHAQA_007958 [Verticillium albo-atrum]